MVRIFTTATRKWHLVFSVANETFGDGNGAESLVLDHDDHSASLSTGYGLIYSCAEKRRVS